MREIRNAYKILIEKPGGKRPPVRFSCMEEIILKWMMGKQG
jgi:hypothetical protein